MRLKKWVVVVIACVSFAAILGAGVLAWAFAPQKADVNYIAHRGRTENKAYANTESAFVDAAKLLDVFGVETDVRATSDGKLVCSHDDAVYFNDGSTLNISESSYSELIQKPLKDTDDAYLCTFARYLEICELYGKTAVAELKAVLNRTQIGRVFYETDSNHSRDKTVFISFELSNLLLCRDYDSTCQTMLLADTADSVATALENDMSVGVYYKLLDRELVNKFHDNGLKVNVWTVNNRFIRTYCDVLEVDFITSDVFF